MTTLRLNKRASSIVLVRLAQANSEAAGALYSRLMNAWLQRDRRLGDALLELDAAECELLQETVPTELQLLGITLP